MGAINLGQLITIPTWGRILYRNKLIPPSFTKLLFAFCYCVLSSAGKIIYNVRLVRGIPILTIQNP